MINQLSAIADCCHQMPLEASLGSEQWLMIVRVSDWRYNLEDRGLFCCRLSQDLSNP